MTRTDNTNPTVAFVLVCWNNVDLLSDCYDSIAHQTYKNHVTLMVDNGSKDKSVAVTKKDYPWVEIHEAGSNLGFAKGNNVGIELLRKKYPELGYIVFLNTDARLRCDWLDVLLNFAGKKPTAALFQSTTLDYYDHQVVDSTHIYISRNGSGTQANWRMPFTNFIGPRKVFGVNAAAAMISCKFIDAQPFKTVFDETMFMYLEDVDLSARATVMGWDNYLVPSTFAYHMGSASSGKNPGFSLYMTYRNNIALLAKNIPATVFMKMLPSIIRSDVLTIKHLRRSGQGKSVPKLVKGRFVGFFRLILFIPGIMKMRPYRQKISKEYLWEIMSKGTL